MNENRKIAKMAEEIEESEEKGKKKRGNTQFQLFMVTQDIDRHIGQNAEEINQAIEDRVGENLLWSYTNIHAGDTQSVWDFERKQFFDVEKLIHAHSVIRVKKKITINALADMLGIEPQYVERPKAGNNAESKMLAYLVHARDSDKKQYDPFRVVASRDAIPYYEIYAKNKKQWDKDRAVDRTKKTEIDEDYIIEKIEEGEIVDADQIILTDEYYRVYSRHPERIDRALKISARRRQLKNAEAIRGGQLKQIVYITGKPRVGKSYLTDVIINAIRTKMPGGDKWLLCDANTDNCFDKYAGQEIMLIDDARGDAMKANQWTRFLDPRRVNEGTARYNDKLVSARVIIFNSYYSVDRFFYFTKGIGENDKSEALDQFIGRIGVHLTVHGRDDIDLAVSDYKPSMRYIEIEDRHGKTERHKIVTEHSFATICEHQTVENIAALTVAIIAANQHAGRVTDAIMDAVASTGIPYRDIIEIRAKAIEEKRAAEEAEKEAEQKERLRACCFTDKEYEALLELDKLNEIERKENAENERYKKMCEESDNEFAEMHGLGGG